MDEAAVTGLRTNVDETEMTRINSQQEVDKSTYLSSIVSTTRGNGERNQSLTGESKAYLQYPKTNMVWRSTILSAKEKPRIFNSNVKAVLQYGSETWFANSALSNRLQTFVNSCPRNILKIRWPEKKKKNQDWRHVGMNRKSRHTGNCQKKVEVDCSYPWTTTNELHPLDRRLESTREEKSRATEEDLETLNRRRNEDSKDNMRCSQEAAQNRVHWSAVAGALRSSGSQKTQVKSLIFTDILWRLPF